MDDFDQTYNERFQPFQKGAENGRKAAEQDALQDVVDDSRLFGQAFVQELGLYDAYIDAYEEFKIKENMPILKSNDLFEEMKKILQQMDFSSLQQLKVQRDQLRKTFQVLKAMTGLKKVPQPKKPEDSYDF